MRIGSTAGIRHAVSHNFSICEMPYFSFLELDIDNALGAPFRWPILDNGKFRQCRAF